MMRVISASVLGREERWPARLDVCRADIGITQPFHNGTSGERRTVVGTDELRLAVQPHPAQWCWDHIPDALVARTLKYPNYRLDLLKTYFLIDTVRLQCTCVP